MKRKRQSESGGVCDPSDNLKIIPRRNCDVKKKRRGNVDQQMRKGSEMVLLRTTDYAVLFPRLPPLSAPIDNIQNFALGE
jgi:hypothetical protein